MSATAWFEQTPITKRIKDRNLKIGRTSVRRPWEVANSIAGAMASLIWALRPRRNHRILISELRTESKEYKGLMTSIVFGFNGSAISNSDRNC